MAATHEIFDMAKPSELSPTATHLVTLAAQFADFQEDASSGTVKSLMEAGGEKKGTADAILRVGCIATSCCGSKALRSLEYALKRSAPGVSMPARFSDVPRTALDAKTTSLASLAVCLVADCGCIQGILRNVRAAGTTEGEFNSAARIAANVAGMRIKYRLFAALGAEAPHAA